MGTPLSIGDNDLQVHRLRALLRDDHGVAALYGVGMTNLMQLIDRLVDAHQFNGEEVNAVLLEIQAAAITNSARRRQGECQ